MVKQRLPGQLALYFKVIYHLKDTLKSFDFTSSVITHNKPQVLES